MKLLLCILLGAVTLIAYTMLEKRLNQRACPSCAYRVAADDPSETCPRCGVPVNRAETNKRPKTRTA